LSEYLWQTLALIGERFETTEQAGVVIRSRAARQNPRTPGKTNRITMSSSSSIAKKARKKAEADFTTWLMMAKLGGFDDLPSNAFLTSYRTRLETMNEAESTVLAQFARYTALNTPKWEAWARAGTKGSHTNYRLARPERA
jgi:hypothetical protein